MSIYNRYLLHQVEVTDDRIELEKLKEQEKIFFFDDVTLFEDELADNGSAVMNVKVVIVLKENG